MKVFDVIFGVPYICFQFLDLDRACVYKDFLVNHSNCIFVITKLDFCFYQMTLIPDLFQVE